MLCRCDGIGRRSGLKIHRWRQRTGSSPVTGTIKRLGSSEYGALTILSGCSAVGSAPALGAGCRRFESCHSDQTKSSVNSFVCGTFSFIPAVNVPMLGFAVFDFIRRNRDFHGHLGVLDVGLSVSSLLFAFRAGSISCLFRVSKRHLHRTLSDILTALVMVP